MPVTQENNEILSATGIDQLKGYDEGTLCYVFKDGWFCWDSTSTDTPDDINVVLPNSVAPGDPGRWLRNQDPEYASDAEAVVGLSDKKILTPESLAALVLGTPQYLCAWRNGNGGTFPVIGRQWIALEFSNLLVNQIRGLSVSSDFKNFTLPAGKFDIRCLNSTSECGLHTLRLFNPVSLSVIQEGCGGVGYDGAVRLKASLDLAFPVTLQIQYYTELQGVLGIQPPEGVTDYPVSQLLISRTV